MRVSSGNTEMERLGIVLVLYPYMQQLLSHVGDPCKSKLMTSTICIHPIACIA